MALWTQHSYGVAENSDRCSQQQSPINTFRLRIYWEEWERIVLAFLKLHVLDCRGQSVFNIHVNIPTIIVGADRADLIQTADREWKLDWLKGEGGITVARWKYQTIDLELGNSSMGHCHYDQGTRTQSPLFNGFNWILPWIMRQAPWRSERQIMPAAHQWEGPWTVSPDCFNMPFTFNSILVTVGSYGRNNTMSVFLPWFYFVPCGYNTGISEQSNNQYLDIDSNTMQTRDKN